MTTSKIYELHTLNLTIQKKSRLDKFDEKQTNKINKNYFSFFW